MTRNRLLTTLLLLTLLPLAGIVPAAAQDGAPTWYWGWAAETNQLVTYTADGESRLLLEHVDFSPNLYRTGPEEMIMAAEIEGAWALVRATSQAAAVIPLPPGVAMETFEGLYPLAFRPPYLMFTTAYRVSGETQGILLDLDAGTAVLLGYVGNMPGLLQAGISADGAVLRYLRHDTPDAEDWYLVERALATGAETLVYTFEDAGEFPPITRCSADGGYWLLRESYETDAGIRYLRFSLLHPDASVEVLADGDLRDAAALQFTFFEDSLVAWQPMCQIGCTLTLTPLAGGEAVTFAVPTPQAPPLFFTALRRYAGGGLLGLGTDRLLVLFDNSQYLLLDAGGDPALLGYFESRSLSPTLSSIVESDWRYIAVVDSPEAPTSFAMVDVLTGEAVLRDQFGGMALLRLTLRPGGFFAYDDGDRQAWFYDGVNQTLHALPEVRGTFFDILPDGSLLGFLNGFGGEELARGIYRYNPASGDVTAVLEGVAPLNVRNIARDL